MSTPCRAVVPWTWALRLRDEGPKSRDFICAMLVLRTFTNDDGFAWPSLRTWAKSARMPINTLRKHMEAAVNEGWLDIDRGDKRKHIYRCAVPIHVKLSERDVELREKILNTFGDIENREPSPICITPGLTQIQDSSDELYQPKDDTDSTTAFVDDEKPSTNGATNGAATPICINADPDLCQTAGPSVSEKSQSVSNSEPSVSPKSSNPLTALETSREVSEVLRSSKEKFQREGAALTRSTTPGVTNGRAKTEETPETRIAKATQLMKATPDIPNATIGRMYKLSEAEVEQIRTEQRLSAVAP